MASILLLSNTAKVVHQVESLAKSIDGIIFQSASSQDAAHSWIERNPFDMFIVDGALFEIDYLSIIEKAWKINPLMQACVYIDGKAPSHFWDARILGVDILSGEFALGDLRQLIIKLDSLRSSSKHTKGVLLVEDLDSPRFIIGTFIESFGYKPVYSKSSAQSALNFLEEHVSDVFCIVTDLNMPEHTGVDLINWVRANPRFEHLPVIVLTAYSTSENLFASIKAGASGFLVKPPQKKDLMSQLAKSQRIYASAVSPRMCTPEDAEYLEDFLLNQRV